jgi:hypothetical protein
MFDNDYVGGYTINEIMENQSSVIRHYFGSFNELDRYHSPFRSDNTPGCRFNFYDGVWYFVDNATYKNRLRFNCIQLVQFMFEIGFQEAINKISEEVIFTSTVDEQPSLFIPQIKVKLQAIPEVNYFTKYGLPASYLREQRVASVKYYYANTRKHNYLKLNSYYNPKWVETFCYLVNGKLELYFPEQDIKFIKQTHGSDYYGQSNREDYVVITEGNKDRMILDYHYKLNTIGLQNVYSLPELTNTKKFILLDPDDAGLVGTQRLLEKYPDAINLTQLSNTYDVSDMYVNDKTQLDNIAKTIYNECING